MCMFSGTATRKGDAMAKEYKEYADTRREVEQLAERGQSLNPLEKYKLTSWVMLAGALNIIKLSEAAKEGARRESSTALKDRFLRAVDVGYTQVSTSEPKIVRSAQQQILEEYKSGVAAYSVLLAQEERLQAEIDAARREKTAAAEAEAALVRKRAEIEKMAAQAGVLDKDMLVSKPVNVIKRNAPRVP